ncbi:MAG: chromosome partitioning protein ParA [Actinomycetota bacterium]|nr:chromosome partitioning protein ParA [Actinomycetota bacterium]
MRVTIGNLKGGAGKTTTAMYLAAGLPGRVALIDAAREQESAYRWSQLAEDFAAVVIPWSTPDLAKRVQAIADDYDHLIIDTPGGGHSVDLLRQACMVTDQLIIPLGPTPMELADLATTIDVAVSVEALHPVDVRVLLTRARVGTIAERETLGWLDEHELPRFRAVIHLREAYAQAFGTAPDDLGEYAEVLAELTQGAHQ